jgi:hypothetical protein
MAQPISGRNGALYVDQSVAATGSAAAVANLNRFELSQTRDKISTDAFGNTTQTYVVGLADASLSFDGFWDSAGGLSAVADGLARKFYLYPTTSDTTKYWFGQMYFDITTSSEVNGVVSVSGSGSAATSVSYVG